MIISQLNGGLGNQMFQYAIGRVLSIMNQDKLYLDTWIYRNLTKMDTKRYYALDSFMLPIKILPDIPSILLNRYIHSIDLIKVNINSNLVNYPKNYILEKSFTFNKDVLSLGKNIYLNGFWQSENYFKGYREVIVSDFLGRRNKPSDKNNLLTEEIKNCESVSLHIRRADYITNKVVNSYHGVCTIDYYSRAMRQIEKKVKSPVYYIFSDDLGWAKSNIHSKFRIEYVGHNQGDSAHEDIRLMSHCKHNIIANSSFSWWGAWLNQNKNKIVISPREWFRDRSIDTSDLIPSSWVRL